MPDYPPDLDISSVMGRPEDQSDFSWWAERTMNPTTLWCQTCEPDRDPLAELLEPYPCDKHSGAVGRDDRLVRVSSMPIAQPGF